VDTTLKPTGWGLPRETRTVAGGTARVVETLEDTPFYSRSLLQTGAEGQTCAAVHESLSLGRFRQGWVQFLLPFKMRSHR